MILSQAQSQAELSEGMAALASAFTAGGRCPERGLGIGKIRAFLVGFFLLNFAPQVGGQVPVLLTRP